MQIGRSQRGFLDAAQHYVPVFPVWRHGVRGQGRLALFAARFVGEDRAQQGLRLEA
jgi:hypothetical protein